MAVAMGFVPDDELGSNELDRWRVSEFPSTNGHVSALGLATFYNGLAQEKLLSRDHLEAVRVSQGGFDPDVVLGPRVADHGWGLGYMLNQRGVAGPNLRSFGHGGSGGSYGFVDLEHRIGYAYVMNYFDATKCNADPRSTALSDEVYRALGVL
jgi:CubicO group peptidase (beta-lactamase class C family)